MMSTTTTRIPLIATAEAGDQTRTAIIDSDGRYSYGELLETSSRVASALLQEQGDFAEQRVAFLVPSSFEYPAVQWGIWRAGGVAVPLCTLHPANELAYVIEDSDASVVVAHPQYEELLRPIAEELGRRFVLTTEIMASPESGAPEKALPNVAASRAAMIVYTSGTTSKPKGAVSTHETISAQITSLVQAWEWTENDHILSFLPLHHLHGIINVLGCALWSGATCEMLPKFEAEPVWARLREGGVTLFMAVPTIYARMVSSWKSAPEEEQRAMTKACEKLRLMVSGSAALPVSTLEEWKTISGHTLLERYGMTEIGMGLSNPLHGERVPGHVGSPLPGVEVRLVDEKLQEVPESTPGEIQVRGQNVFREYWRRPEATAKAFVDGWFKTGDIAVRENNIYRILGRDSVDIIKSGGFKVSALEIEEELRNHAAIAQCAVVGVEDLEWGERVCAVVSLEPESELDLPALRHWAKERLAVYKVPSRLLLLDELPRNAMGKVVKPELVKLFQQENDAA